ncbi:MAG: 1-deoxy-D-xylulose-5-phosphate reductoisomerase [Desulfobacteraceae bacterium]|jgi:1-deoxy-D-xylulose-5-phosphate reductoisomerase
MKNLAILGSTGSIGRSTLDLVAAFPERLSAKVLTARTNLGLLLRQIDIFRPELAVVFDRDCAESLQRQLPSGARVQVLHGEEGYSAAASWASVDQVVTAMVGAAGLAPTLAAIAAGKDIALANKETLVMAGELVMARAAARGVSILPVDSEHSAIFQCLAGQRRQDLQKIFLTASGGPFRGRSREEIAAVRPEDALAHPTWRMGPKISIDSATLMNKGLEVIEAKWLFGLAPAEIEVVVHPQSIIHSMVAYRDGSILAQLGVPDMKSAIACALSWPERWPLGQPLPDFAATAGLSFEKPDLAAFPCLTLAFEACQAGGTHPAVLNAANEVAVEAFLAGQIGFLEIPCLVEHALGAHSGTARPQLADILNADRWARGETRRKLSAGR